MRSETALADMASHLAGASINYNAPGEMHLTLLVDDPNVLLPVPKLTHYTIEFLVGAERITFNGPTQIWTLDEEGYLTWPAGTTTGSGEGPYSVTATNVPYLAAVGDPPYSGPGEHPASGGAYWSFWTINDGPYTGQLVAYTMGGSGYGDTTVDSLGEGGGWEERFAGLVWDVDATETEAVYYGIDYLSLYQYVVDERFDPEAPDKPVDEGGSYYIASTGHPLDWNIREIILEQLNYAHDKDDSPVGFITVGETPPEMSYNRDLSDGIYSTLMSSFNFIVGLINSDRAGTGRNTRISVVPDATPGTYKVIVVYEPGDVLGEALEYGDLVQGYRVVQYGRNWATRANAVGRSRNGVKVEFYTYGGYADEFTLGRFSAPALVLETKDLFDLRRRTRQAALEDSFQTRQMGFGLKLGSFSPLGDFDVCDLVQVNILHGAVDTVSWNAASQGDGLWWIIGCTWESYDDGHWITNISVLPHYYQTCT